MLTHGHNQKEEKAAPTERDSLLVKNTATATTTATTTANPHPLLHPTTTASSSSTAAGPPPLPPRRPGPPRQPGAASVPDGSSIPLPPVLVSHRRVASATVAEDVGKQRRLGWSGHFRNKSSLRHLMKEDILPGLQSESDLFRGNFRRSLVDANAGRTFFFDMSVTRSLSVLPEDMTDLMEETVLKQIPHHHPKPMLTTLEQEESDDNDQNADYDVESSPQTSITLQYASLLMAVIAVSSNGTALSLLHGVPPALKLYWRMSVTGLLLFGLALPRLLEHGWPMEMTAWPKIVSLFCAAACFAGQGLCFVNALQYTSIGNVVIGANSQAILLVLGKLVSGESVHWMEGGGVVLAFFGCMMCAQDEARAKGITIVVEDELESSFFERSMGEMLAFCAGICGVFYLILAKSIRSSMPVSLFVSCVMLLGSFMVIPFCYAAEPTMMWNNDPNIGFLGWSSWERIFVIAYIVLVCNLLGTVGFVRAMQFFDNLIIAVATLLEPLIATIIAFLLGVGLLPGPLGWLGNVVVVLGTLGVVIPSINNKAGAAVH